jgi:hypothetical protein
VCVCVRVCACVCMCVKGVTRSNETEADAHTACHTAKKSGDPDAETDMSLTLYV